MTTYSNPTRGLGDGFKFGFGGSYILNDFINAGLNFHYFNSTIKNTETHLLSKKIYLSKPMEWMNIVTQNAMPFITMPPC